jgi:hypothetical protein
VPTAIRIHGSIVADPAMVTAAPSALKHQNSDLTVICSFVLIGLVASTVATMALPLDQDTVTLLAQFG